MSARKLILLVAVLLGSLAAGLLALLAWVLAPDAPVEDLVGRTPPPVVVTRTEAEPAAGETFTLSGRVTWEDGGPAEGLAVEVDPTDDSGRTVSTTAEDGTWSATVDSPVDVRMDHLPSTPWSYEVEGPRSDLDFSVPPLCPLRVRVLSSSGDPIPRAWVAARVSTSTWNRRWTDYRRTGPDGVGKLDDVACGVATIQARATGFVKARRDEVDTLVQREVTLTLTPGVGLSGQVVDPEDRPVEGVSVRVGLASSVTDEEGHYSLAFDPAATTHVRVTREGYTDLRERLRVPEDSEAIEADFVLHPSREVTVYCAGLPDESCKAVMPLMCTRPWAPFGESCSRKDPSTCTCSAGPVAIRGGGRSVSVAPDQDEAWLDFRDPGGLRGRVLLDGVPTPCSTYTLRIPDDLSDVTRGGVAGRGGACDEEGRFEVLGLAGGTYVVEIVAGTVNRRPDPVQVDGTVVDLGDVDLSDGTDVEGVVIDGLTGQGTPGHTVVAVQDVDDDLAPGTAVAVSRSEGRFVLRGLSDGTWSVFLVSRPLTPATITVSEGTASSEPLLETGDADLLAEQGFGLATDDDGELVVSELDPQGPGAQAGLEVGDRVEGVTVMGLDVGEVLPGLEDQVLDFVLEHYSGPGVGLVVDRDGERVEVELDPGSG